MNDNNPQQNASGLAIKIGEWLLYPPLNRLVRNDEIIHLEPKAVAVLELLVRREGQPASRQELLDHVWGDTIVSDDALTQVIIKLRKAFGDDSRHPAYIQTIPKRGYRLLAPVQILHDSPNAEGQSESRHHLRYGVILLLLAVSGLYLIPGWMKPENGGEQLNVVPIATSDPMSISVQPFEALDQTQESESFALGFTSDLTTDLSKLSALRVIHTPSLKSQRAVSRYLVTGKVQRVNQTLKLYVNLVDAESLQQLWSERFDGTLDEFFDMQRAMSEQIVKKLSITVTETEKERLAKRYTRNIDAYEHFIAGQVELLRRERSSNDKARDWYRQAIEHDPAFARAYAGLALSYAADFRNQWVDDGEQALRKAREMAVTAQQIDPAIPEVYWVLAYVDTQHQEHDKALQALHRAVQLDPSYADAHALIGGIYTYKGQPQKTVSLLREAIRLRPDAGFLYYLLLGRAYFFIGDYEQALINLEETIDRNPESLEAHLYIAACAIADGDLDKAKWEVEEIDALESDFDLSKWFDTYPMTDKDQIAELTDKLSIVGF